MPAISVIVPVYNVEPYLRDCIASILGQTFADFELIAVDDGSTDRSGAILDELAASDSRIRVIHRTNGGPSAARNDALRIARGEFLVFVDSDDLLFPDSLMTLILLTSDADVGVGGFTDFSDATTPQHSAHGNAVATFTGIEAAETMLYRTDHDMNTSAWGKIFRHELFEAIRFEEGLLYEDTELIPKVIARAERVAQTEREVYCYRQRPGSILHTFGPKRFDVLDSCERLAVYFTTNATLKRAAEDRLLSAAFNMLLLIGHHNYADKEARRRCEAIVRRLRRATLSNPRTRRKNRAAALLTYLIGLRPFSYPLFARLFLPR